MEAMASVRLRPSTRELLLEAAAERQVSVDQLIVAGLRALRRDERRRTATADARAVREDVSDLAEVAAIQQEMAALHAR